MTPNAGQQFIGGARSGAGQPLLHSIDAHTGQALPGAFYQASDAEVDAAARAAAQAYPVYRALAPQRRAQFLDSIAEQLDALGEDFIALVSRETALPAARIQGERARTSGQLRLFAQLLRRGDFLAARIDRAQPQRTPLPRSDIRQCRMGLGPVAVFGASNFPWPFPLPVATPLRRWPPAARWCSRRTAGIWPLPRRSPRPSFVRPSAAPCRLAYST